jgi:hypothetical protein
VNLRHFWPAAWAIALSVVATCASAGPVLPGPANAVRHAHENEDHGSTPAALSERRRLVAEGERMLSGGNVEGARHAFEQAALQVHSAHIELGILRTQMQAGEYRQALAFAAHTAGVHLDEVEGRVFYAWLLSLGGQVAIADQTLKQAEASEPDHPMVQEARRRFQSGVLLANGPLLSRPARLAPYPSGVTVSQHAGTVCSALLLADGRHALAPRAAIPATGAVWLRNGLGQAVAARIEQHDEVLGLTLLTLSAPLPVAGGEIVSPRDAFPGSPAFALDYPADPEGRPAWPTLRAGFLGTPALGAQSGVRRLGVELPGHGLRGGPVYDQGGRLVGLAMGAAAGAGDQLMSIGLLRSRFGERFGAQAAEFRPSAVGADELYERAMKTSLQVLVTTPAD